MSILETNCDFETLIPHYIGSYNRWEKICMRYWPSLFGQDGWILAKFFFCVFMDRDEVVVHKNAKKERTHKKKEHSIRFILPTGGASHIINSRIRLRCFATPLNITVKIYFLPVPRIIRYSRLEIAIRFVSWSSHYKDKERCKQISSSLIEISILFICETYPWI